jgi:glycosyltransferase involved in cell wall biosynthesis
VKISVAIATRDRAGFLERALASLALQQNAPPFEVLVVDNGSSDGTKAVAERFARGELDLRYLYEAQPNRGKARNRAIAVARGDLIAFCDDDVQAPPGWLAAHVAAHGERSTVVNGPILNVASFDERPKPAVRNYSRAFLCTCNASVPREALQQAGGFDESFDLYGWEDTELGVRLSEAGVLWKFAWDAYIWHVKTPGEHTIDVEARKAVEKARMAARFLHKHASHRARLATGAHAANVLRGRYLLPDRLLSWYAALATAPRAPRWARVIARAQLIDGLYTRELVRVLDAGDAR